MVPLLAGAWGRLKVLKSSKKEGWEIMEKNKFKLSIKSLFGLVLAFALLFSMWLSLRTFVTGFDQQTHFAFHSIELGMEKDRVVQILGEPYGTSDQHQVDIPFSLIKRSKKKSIVSYFWKNGSNWLCRKV